MTKLCLKCGKVKPLALFKKCKTVKSGYSSPCKQCVNATAAVWHSKHPGYKAAHRGIYDNEKHRAYCLKYYYGITTQEFATKLREQGGVCAICESADSRSTRTGRLHVDHCHKTGAFRGLLCNPCNTTLGKFHDDPARLRKAADYLEKNGL